MYMYIYIYIYICISITSVQASLPFALAVTFAELNALDTVPAAQLCLRCIRQVMLTPTITTTKRCSGSLNCVRTVVFIASMHRVDLCQVCIPHHS